MSRNKIIALPLRIVAASVTAIGGQAVIDGVLMRNGDVCALAVRRTDGHVCASRLPWKSFFVHPVLDLPFLRGFPALLEMVFNGICALDRSSVLLGEQQRMTRGRMIASVFLAMFLALGLFVLAPHFLSLLMHLVGAGGDVDAFSFHVWDGLFKCAIFVAYILLISLVPDIRRMFEYHGAEHKVAHAWERGEMGNAARMSRFHPRCGTTFVLFVVAVAILLQSLFVPLLLRGIAAQSSVTLHLAGIGIKLLLVIPVSAIAYELINLAAGLSGGLLTRVVQAPGLCLQRLTTREPQTAQLEVAAVALAESLELEEAELIVTAPYEAVATLAREGLEQI